MRNKLILMILTLFFSACGYKGPLYLPQDKPAAAKPAPVPPAPASATTPAQP